MNYSATYFRDNLPDIKRRQDSFLVRHIYRPLSFYMSSFVCKFGLNANQISLISIFLAITISILYITGSWHLGVIASILVNLWMILDCTDGNLARCVKRLPYGEFLDAISGYYLIALLFGGLGINVYINGGLLVQRGNIWIVFYAFLASISDSLARLTFQKYLNVSIDEKKVNIGNETINEVGKKSILYKLHDRIDKEVGLNGIFIPFITICSIYIYLDIFILFYFLFYFINFIGTVLTLLKRVKR